MDAPKKRRGRPRLDATGRAVPITVSVPPSLDALIRAGIQAGRWPSFSAGLVYLAQQGVVKEEETNAAD